MVVEAHQSYAEEKQRPAALWHRIVSYALKAMVPIAILALAIPYANELYRTGPVAERKPRERVARVVDVVEVQPGLQGPRIEAWGEVVPTRTLNLRPEVAGNIINFHPQLVAGGIIEAGERLIEMDKTGASFALAEAEATIAEIQARIAIERGQATRAARDLERSPVELNEEQRALVLREPQMAQLVAELASAEAAREQAMLNLKKTSIFAPFDVLVLSEQVARGTAVTVGAQLATLVSVDSFTVNVAVPAASMEWIDLDSAGVVRLSQPEVWADGEIRTGRIARSGASLSETGRMVEVLVEVDDPFSREDANFGQHRLILGSFLRAEFDGRPVPDALVLDRDYLRDDSKVWVMTEEDTLDIREVDIAWRGADEVLISNGIETGDRIVTTNLAITAQGMKLRLKEAGE
ncbi:MAG: efflux RND transporter periplasmic adaptor subunit [Pseudomonadota bacterium]